MCTLLNQTKQMNDDLRYHLKSTNEFISGEFGNGQSSEELIKLKNKIIEHLRNSIKHTKVLFEEYHHEAIVDESCDSEDCDDFDYELSVNK